MFEEGWHLGICAGTGWLWSVCWKRICSAEEHPSCKDHRWERVQHGSTCFATLHTVSILKIVETHFTGRSDSEGDTSSWTDAKASWLQDWMLRYDIVWHVHSWQFYSFHWSWRLSCENKDWWMPYLHLFTMQKSMGKLIPAVGLPRCILVSPAVRQ